MMLKLRIFFPVKGGQRMLVHVSIGNQN
uniref:Uncharacterized protein n=1 Tax=Arundo donax TaxID=35708 RepID=A0A0A9GQP5_ARUDO